MKIERDTKPKDIQTIQFWGFFAGQKGGDMPDGTIGAVPAGCNNPACDTGCPAVALVVAVEGQEIEIRIDPVAAENLGGIILAAAREAQGIKTN